MSKIVIKFENEIFDITNKNIKEKILPYINELAENLLNNHCTNVRIITQIKKLSNGASKLILNIKDI